MDEGQWDLPFVGGQEPESGFVPAPASDPPSHPFHFGPRRCAYYEPMEPGRRGRPARFVILTGPHGRISFGDSCAGHAKFIAHLAGWRAPTVPAAEGPPPRYKANARPDLDWSASEYHRDYYALRARQEREFMRGRR